MFRSRVQLSMVHFPTKFTEKLYVRSQYKYALSRVAKDSYKVIFPTLHISAV